MKANRKFIEKEAGVSAVICVILMVAITVAIAATVYVYVSGMIGGTATKTSTLSMNAFSQDDGNDRRIWLVSGIEGEPISDTSYAWSLLDTNGENASTSAVLTNYSTDTEFTFNEVVGPDYVNAGDTFTLVAPDDGYFVFMLTDTATGQTIYKSSSVKY